MDFEPVYWMSQICSLVLLFFCTYSWSKLCKEQKDGWSRIVSILIDEKKIDEKKLELLRKEKNKPASE